MCFPIKCRVCGKTTWGGCGEHIDAVRTATAPDQWCPGHDEDRISNRAPAQRLRRLRLR